MASKEQLIKKWEAMEGKMSIKDIGDRYLKENLATLLENQETKDIEGTNYFTEASDGVVNINQLATDGLSGGSASVDAYKFRPVALALVRRTFPDLFANKVIGVQAMSTPVGLAYAMRILYNDGNSIEAAWDKMNEYAGYTGSQTGTSGALNAPVGTGSLSATAGATGIYDTSAAGVVTSAGEAWQIYDSGTSAAPDWPQLKLKIDQVAIEAKTRKLAASFSIEAAQDIRAMHGIDVEREMVNMLQYEITAELDRELLAAMKTASVDTANGGAVVSPIDLTGRDTGIDGRWSGEKYMNVIASIIYQANQIAISTRRGAGNFCIVSGAIATMLQAAGHQFVNFSQTVNPSTTAAYIGKLNGTIDVYRDQYARTDYALIGYKGPGIADSGLIFSPYIMGLTNRAISPADFSPRIGVISRYALTNNLLGSGRYYRTIPFFNTNKVIAGI